MIKNLTKFLLTLLVISILIIFYLSTFGFKTTKFNNKIIQEIQNINKKVNLDLKSIKFLLNPMNFTINVKTYGTEILIDKKNLNLEFIKTNIPLKSIINKEFSINDLQLSTKSIKINDAILLAKSFKNSTQLFILDKIVKGGFIKADINLNFDSDGKIKDNYEIKGFIKKGKLSFFRDYNIDNLDLLFKIKNKEYILEDISSKFNQIKISFPLIKIKKKKHLFFVEGEMINNKKDINNKLLDKLLNNTPKNLGIDNISFGSENNFSFNNNKKFKINDFNLKSKINLENLNYKKYNLQISKYLPNIKDSIILKDHIILINYYKDKLEIKGDGQIKIAKKLDQMNYKITKINNKYDFNGNIDVNKNKLLIDTLQYEKKNDKKSLLELQGSYIKDKIIKIDSVSLKEKNNIFLIKDLKLDSNFKIIDVRLVKLDYVNNNKFQNQINLIKKKEKYEIYGKNFDASKLISEILHDDNKDGLSFFKYLNSIFNIKIIKTYLNKDTSVNNLNGNITIKKNKVHKLNLLSTFSNKKELNLTINTNNNKEKITTLFSGYPKPLVKQYKFIKGFEEGVLDYYSIKKNDVSNSVLKIDNFKIQEVPALARLLTLASLQGIADLLTGEGIRFDNFEMKFSNNKRLMQIDEMYAIGPAISILMEGYIEDKKLTSLKGTLVPATTINKAIGSIPLLGDILVGKKIGEGVFGVSFKIKGPPKNLKTTVNPIKTLTPRFITRTLEKIKKN